MDVTKRIVNYRAGRVSLQVQLYVAEDMGVKGYGYSGPEAIAACLNNTATMEATVQALEDQ